MHPPPQPFRAHSPHALWDTPGACTSASPQLTPSPGSSLPSDNSPSPPSSHSSTIPTSLPQLPGASSTPSPSPPTTNTSPIVSQQEENTKNARVLAHGLKLDMPPTAHVPPRPYPFGGLAPASGHYPFNAPPLHIPPIGSHHLSQPSQLPTLPPLRSPHPHAANPPYPTSRRDGKRSPTDPEAYYTPSPASYYSHSQTIPSSSPPPLSAVSTVSSPTTSPATPGGVCRLPPIFQVERQQVTTSATQAASASRRRNEANFLCPVPGCGSTFTRRFNLRGHLRSHTEERPYKCEWPGCNKGFARQHDCKRHQNLHSAKSQINACQGCGKTFSRLDALNRHLRSEGGSECRQASASPNSVLESAIIGTEARASSPDAKIERSPTPTLSVTPTDETRSTDDGGADSTD